MKQRSLFFGDTAPYQPHSSTSKLAADSMRKLLTGKRLQVLRSIVNGSHGGQEDGLTDQECQRWCGISESTQRPRRVELQRAGLIEAKGTRPSLAGRPMTVWVATEKGRLWLREMDSDAG